MTLVSTFIDFDNNDNITKTASENIHFTEILDECPNGK